MEEEEAHDRRHHQACTELVYIVQHRINNLPEKRAYGVSHFLASLAPSGWDLDEEVDLPEDNNDVGVPSQVNQAESQGTAESHKIVSRECIPAALKSHTIVSRRVTQLAARRHGACLATPRTATTVFLLKTHMFPLWA